MRCSKGSKTVADAEDDLFGGGTPTMLSDTHLERLLRACVRTGGLSEVAEFTMEANPRTVTPSKRRAHAIEMGVTHLSRHPGLG